MSLSDYETFCISHLLSINGAKYTVGLFTEEGLLVNGEWLSSIHKNENDIYDQYKYNIKTNELKTSKRKSNEKESISAGNSGIKLNCVADVSNNGMRFEGACLNCSPFGYGSLYNSSNELVYRGVMINDKKECFGIEFYPSLGKIEYIGCYWNNERHGFGMLYDRKGELVYEGYFICGSSVFETIVVLKDSEENEGNYTHDEYNNEMSIVVKNADNDRIVHSLIHELIIDEECGNDFEGDLSLCGFNYLERIVVKTGSLIKLNSLIIKDNPVLKNIEIVDGEKYFYRFERDYSRLISFQSLKELAIES